MNKYTILFETFDQTGIRDVIADNPLKAMEHFLANFSWVAGYDENLTRMEIVQINSLPARIVVNDPIQNPVFN